MFLEGLRYKTYRIIVKFLNKIGNIWDLLEG
jgi:hypothetical protein